jgi:predicted O-methyltransferase YrrM
VVQWTAAVRDLDQIVVADDVAWFEQLRQEFTASVTAMYGHLDAGGEVTRHAVAGSIKRLDALKLAAAIATCRPTRVLEVGSFLGFSTRVVLDAAASSDATVVSVDPRIRHRVFDDVGRHVVAFNPTDRLVCRDAFFAEVDIDRLLYDYLTYEPRFTRRQARRKLGRIEVIRQPFDEFDFVFIDGDHSYVATVANLALALRMARPGALIAVHDALTWPSVVPAAMDVATRVPHVRVCGVSGPSSEEFFVGARRRSDPRELAGRARAWLLGPDPASTADGLCFLEVAPDADLDALRRACETFTPEVIDDLRNGHGDALANERPIEGLVPRTVRRARRLRSDPAGMARIARARLVRRLPHR